MKKDNWIPWRSNKIVRWAGLRVWAYRCSGPGCHAIFNALRVRNAEFDHRVNLRLGKSRVCKGPLVALVDVKDVAGWIPSRTERSHPMTAGPPGNKGNE